MIGSEGSVTVRVGQQQWCLVVVGGAAAAYVLLITTHKSKGKKEEGPSINIQHSLPQFLCCVHCRFHLYLMPPTSPYFPSLLHISTVISEVY